MSLLLKSKLHVDIPQFSSALTEFRCGSYDGYAQGLKILGPNLGTAYPDIYHLPEQWHALRGSQKVQLLVLQKKACHILSTLAENPQTDIASDEKLKNRLSTIEFLTEMSVQYGQKLTKEVYQRIQTPLREQFDSGDENFSKEYQTEFQRRLEKAQLKLTQEKLEFPLPAIPDQPTLPSLEEREAYWKTIRHITRSKEGHIGVFYTHSPALAKDLVVKAPLRPAQECFASRIFQRLGMQKLGFLTPDTVVIDRKSKEGLAIEKALEPSEDFQSHRKSVAFTRFFVMNRVYGRAIEEIDEAVAAQAFTNDTLGLKTLLKQIGMVAAVDTLTHYQDRLSHIGYTNWGNLMCLEYQSRLIPAVAIDQSVDVSKSSVFMPSTTKLARVTQIADDVLTSPDNISEAATALWEEIPEHIQSYITREEALAVLQEGLVTGFKAIACHLTPEALLEIDASLRDLYTDQDFVKVEDLISAQQMIAAKL